ncbi:MAG: DTW domain-containing protein [Oligoflexia bacterium]|nr:DTW domain-containing protein [Oligoflexia bacterium]
MNLNQYLKNKAQRKEALEDELKNHRKRCPSCFRSQKVCFCKEIASFSTQSEFRILMHPKEARKEQLGTGRLTNICLKNSKIIVDENFENNPDVFKLLSNTEEEYAQYFPMILYPGDKSHNITQSDFPEHIKDNLTLKNKKLLIFVIDGTWTCAKTMMRNSRNLHNLPRISFEPGVLSQFKIKQQPAHYCLCTIESIYYLLNELEKWKYETLLGKQNVLLNTLHRLVDFQIECTKNPTFTRYRPGTYKAPDERSYSKKWSKRKVYFELK